jgi:hypothetical protein
MRRGGIAPSFLTSALDGSEWSASLPSHFTPRGKSPLTHGIGGWVGSKTSLDDVKRRKILPLPGLEFRPLGRPAHKQSLYRLRYPGAPIKSSMFLNRFIGRAAAQRLEAGFPPRRPGFAYGQHVGFVVDKVALGQVFSEYFGFPCQSFHRFLHYHNQPGLTK